MQFQTECKIKIKNNSDEYYKLDEMMALKLYTDTSDYTAAFRRSYWTSSTSIQRKSFYWWAMTLYKTALFHAKPIRCRSNQKTPKSLFHGICFFCIQLIYLKNKNNIYKSERSE